MTADTYDASPSSRSQPCLVLASASPRRLELLNQVGIACCVDPASVELAPSSGPPEQNAQRIAVGKAMMVAHRHKADDAVVLGADTLVHLDGQTLGKPRDRMDAKRMLAKLSGREHEVVTGYAIVRARSSQVTTGFSSARVRFRCLSDREIERYVATGEGDDKAGAYAIQERGALFVDRITGDYYAIVGLPLGRIIEALRVCGIDPL